MADIDGYDLRKITPAFRSQSLPRRASRDRYAGGGRKMMAKDARDQVVQDRKREAESGWGLR